MHTAQTAVSSKPEDKQRGKALTDLVISQLTDLFRIGLLVGLVVTMKRTSHVTGKYLPLALGIVFVAVILPSTMPPVGVALTDAVLAGLISNSVILVHILAIARLVARFRR